MSKDFNISISGWSGSGTSTLALILANLFNRKYYRIGEIYRQLGEELGYSSEGSSRPKFDAYAEPIIGPTIDRFIEYLLIQKSNIVLDSDIGTFLIGKHPKVYSVFLVTSQEVRMKRAGIDERENASAVITERDIVHKEKYNQLHDIDYFNEEQIEKKFSLMLDTTEISIESEVNLVLKQIHEQFNLENYSELLQKVPIIINDFESKGKDKLRQELKTKDLMDSPFKIMQEITGIFPEDIAEFPPKLQEIFLGQTGP